MAFEKDPDDLGALWSKTGARGDYMTGTVSGVKVVCFHNDRWTEGGNMPKWRVLKSKPRADRDDGPPPEPVTDDSIPF
jgi:hypothetical protein